jgi:hypothetical protein
VTTARVAAWGVRRAGSHGRTFVPRVVRRSSDIMRWTTAAATLAALTGCYAGPQATADVNAAWRGRTRAELVDRWGAPDEGEPQDPVWTHHHHHVELPSAHAAVSIGPDHVDVDAAARPGAVWTTTTAAVAHLDPAQRILAVEGRTLDWGAPRDANVRWGAILGGHLGLGRLGNTGTPLPGGGAYVGGMLGPTLGLVGAFAMTFGKDGAGGALGLSSGLALQWWPETDVWLRAGPAAVLGSDPGFDNWRFRPGATLGASYAIVRGRVFVLDLRLDGTVASSLSFGTIGVGVNVN